MTKQFIFFGVFALMLFSGWAYTPMESSLHAAPMSESSTIPGTIPPADAVTLSVSAPVQSYSPGDVVVFELNLSNIYSSTLTDFYLEVTVPPYSTFDANSSTAGWEQVVAGTVGGASGAPCPDGAGPGTACTFYIPSLAPGNFQPLSFAAQLSNDIPRTTTGLGLSVALNGAELTTSLPETATTIKIFDVLLLPALIN